MSRRARLEARARALRTARAFFDARGFVEIEAPIIVRSPGLEPHLDPFAVEGHAGRRWLHTSPEYALKRLLGELGFERLYAVGPCFRDEPTSSTHSPEFTMLEWYEVGLDLAGLMAQTEALLAEVCRALHGGAGVTFRGVPFSLEPPFERLSMREAFRRHAGVDPWEHPFADDLRRAGRAAGVDVPTDSPCWDDVFFQIFLNSVEPKLGQGRPTFLYGYPASQAALARLNAQDPSVAERFELYAGGLELANAFDELIDPAEQRRRFEDDQEYRRRMQKPAPPIDEALMAALGRMRPTAGIALGFDRLVMLLTDAETIADVRTQPWDLP